MKKNKKDLNVPMPGEEQRPPKKGKGGPKGEKQHKKKKKHHTLIWIIILVLLIGILIGLLIDRGFFFPGGEGWIGGLLGIEEGTGSKNGEIDISNGDITPVPSPVATQPVNPANPKVYLRVSGRTVYMNDVEVSGSDILEQLSLDTYHESEIIIIDDDAIKSVFTNLKTLLENNGYSFKEGDG